MLRKSTYKRGFFLHHWTLTNEAWEHYEFLKESQWWSKARLTEHQIHRLNCLIAKCKKDNNFYADRLPDRIVDLSDLKKIPTVSKGDLAKALTAGKFNKCDNPVGRTGGSTGMNFSFLMTVDSLNMRWGTTQRCYEWTGYRFGERCFRLWHSTLGLDKTQAFKEKLDAFWSNRKFYPVFELNDNTMEKLVRDIMRKKPFLLDGYAESLHVLAEYIQKTQANPALCSRLYDAGIRGIVSSAQTLEEKSRKLIEKSFGCPVFNKYGAREFSGIAYQCNHMNGMHVCGESYIVEVDNERKDGSGDVLITDLYNDAMPFIRYRLGDIVTLEKDDSCECGRHTQIIKKVVGRKPVAIRGANGVFMPGTFFPHYFKDYEDIGFFQVIQEKLNSILIKLVPSHEGSIKKSTIEKIQSDMYKYFGTGTELIIEEVAKIPLTKVGKKPQAVRGMFFSDEDMETISNPK